MSKKLTFAILGMGGMGRTHADNLRAMENVEIAALCSVPVDDANKYNAERGTDYPVYDDFDKMLAERSFDALYVCLPPFAHDGQIEKAAAKGIAVFAEKPLALTVARAESIAKAVADAKVKSQVGYHMRFGGAVKKVREWVLNGKAGRPTLFEGSWVCNCLHSPWWKDVTLCGGQVFEQIIHIYDAAYNWMGKAERVSGYTANLCHQDTPGYTVEDTSAGTILFKNGGVGSIIGSNASIPGVWRHRLHLICENMTAEFSDYNHAKVTFYADEKVTEEVNLSFDGNPYADEDAYFVSVLRGEAPEFCTIAEALDTLRMVAGVVASSAANGAPVSL